jgi:hypothetical protein
MINCNYFDFLQRMDEAAGAKLSDLMASVLQIKNSAASTILPEIGQLARLADVCLVSSSDKTSVRCVL